MSDRLAKPSIMQVVRAQTPPPTVKGTPSAPPCSPETRVYVPRLKFPPSPELRALMLQRSVNTYARALHVPVVTEPSPGEEAQPVDRTKSRRRLFP